MHHPCVFLQGFTCIFISIYVLVDLQICIPLNVFFLMIR